MQYSKQYPRIREFCNLECVQQNDPYFISAISAFNPASAILRLKSNFYCLVIFHYLLTLLQKRRLQDYTYNIVWLTAIKVNLPKKCKYCYSQVRRFATSHKCRAVSKNVLLFSKENYISKGRNLRFRIRNIMQGFHMRYDI